MENSAHVAVTRKKAAALVPRLRTGTAAAHEGKTRNGAVIHRKRCSAPEGLIRRPLEPCFHRRTLSGQGTVCPLNSDQRHGCPWNEPSGVSPPTPRTGKVVPPLKSLPKGMLPLDAATRHPIGLTPSIGHLLVNGKGCPSDESWPLPRRGVAAAWLSAGVRQKDCPLPSANFLVRKLPASPTGNQTT